MPRHKSSLATLGVLILTLGSPGFAADGDRDFKAVVAAYQRDEARLPRLLHYQQVTGGLKGESVRREAWVSLGGGLVKTVEERRGPVGAELVETSMNDDLPYFVFRQKMTLLPDGRQRVEEERKYRREFDIVRWAKRSATLPAGAPIDLKAVKQELLPLANLAPEDARFDRTMEAAAAILATLQAAVKPDRDPTAKAGPDWQRMKLVKGTSSPNGRYQLAWAPDGAEIDWSKFKAESGNDFNADRETDVKNFIFDMETMRLAGETLGRHFGTRAHYNHHGVEMAWSPDSTTFIELNTEKWEYSGCCVGRVADGRVVGCIELGKPAAKEAVKFLVGKKNRAWKKHGEKIVITLRDPEVANDGTLAITVFGEVPKSEEEDSVISVRVRLRLALDGNGLSLTPLGAALAPL